MKKSKKSIYIAVASLSCIFGLFANTAAASSSPVANAAEGAEVSSTASDAEEKHEVHKVLFIGDSMTGWLAERLNAYGQANGFEVVTVVWDGSTIRKWGATPKLAGMVSKYEPDALFVSLGMNELFEPRPEQNLSASVDKILSAAGDVPVVWIGPPSWPGRGKGEVLDSWLSEKVGERHYFSSFGLDLQRQSRTNPHPTRTGMVKWMDEVIKWLPQHTDLQFESLDSPGPSSMSRGKVYIYKRMKESL